MQQCDFAFVTANDEAIPLADEPAVLPVEADLGDVLPGLGQTDLDLLVGGQHNWAMAQGVRADGHQRQGFQARVHDRTAARQRIGGGAGGSGHDQSVGALAVDQLAVGVDLELDHADAFMTVQHDIVERPVANRFLLLELDATLEQEAGFHAVAAVEDVLQVGLDLFQRDIGEKAETTEIDAEQGDLRIDQGAGRRQQGAVTTHRYRQIRLGGDVFDRNRLQAVETAVAVEGMHQQTAMTFQGVEDAHQRFAAGQAALAHDDADGFEGSVQGFGTHGLAVGLEKRLEWRDDSTEATVTAMAADYDLDDRAQRLLRELVKAYTRDGHPVPSRTLLKLSRLDVSSATVRNIMVRLEQMGLVAQPHTSAGRVPTAAGYRFFIDSLLEVKDPDPEAREALSAELSPSKTTRDLVHTATDLLSNMTRLAGVISVSRPPQIEVRHLEFMKLTDRRVLVILVINSDQVHNRVIQVDREYSELELSEAARLIGQYLIGSDFNQALARLREEIRQHRDDVADILESTLKVMGAVCGESERDELLTAGESNLLQFAELQDIHKLQELFEVFQQKRELLHLLEGCADAEGVQIFIGSESGYDVLQDCSVVSAPYRIGDEVLGVLGVIGPTRIAYDRIIPAVDMTAKILSSALNSSD